MKFYDGLWKGVFSPAVLPTDQFVLLTYSGAKTLGSGAQEMNESTINRISISIAQGLLEDFNRYVRDKGYENRSAAISHLLRQELLQCRGDRGQEVLAGSITLFYSEERSSLPMEIAQLQRVYIDQVISSLHVLLEKDSVMEVLVVQGPLWKLKEMAGKFVSLKGVETGKLTLTSAILPPVYSKVAQQKDEKGEYHLSNKGAKHE